jgi:hypothetical protein
MAEPFGVPAGRVSSDVPGVIPGGPRPLPPAGDAPVEDAASSAGGGGSGDGTAEKPAEDSSAAETEADGGGDSKPTPLAIGEGEEIIELTGEEREAVPTRSDDHG